MASSTVLGKALLEPTGPKDYGRPDRTGAILEGHTKILPPHHRITEYPQFERSQQRSLSPTPLKPRTLQRVINCSVSTTFLSFFSSAL